MQQSIGSQRVRHDLATEQQQSVPDNRWASLVAKPVKNLSAMQETLVRFLGLEDSLEKG